MISLSFFTIRLVEENTKKILFFATSKLFLLACFLLLHVDYLTITPPKKYPFLFVTIIMLLCFSHFVEIFLYSNTKQWPPFKLSAPSTETKKHLWFYGSSHHCTYLSGPEHYRQFERGNKHILAHSNFMDFKPLTLAFLVFRKGDFVTRS